MWPFKSKKQKEKERKRSGYDFAAGELLRGESPSSLYLNVHCAIVFKDYDSFDEGMSKALNDWEKKTGETHEIYDAGCRI